MRGGFSLVETLFAIVIFSLCALSLPSLTKSLQKPHETALLSELVSQSEAAMALVLSQPFAAQNLTRAELFSHQRCFVFSPVFESGRFSQLQTRLNVSFEARFTQTKERREVLLKTKFAKTEFDLYATQFGVGEARQNSVKY